MLYRFGKTVNIFNVAIAAFSIWLASCSRGPEAGPPTELESAASADQASEPPLDLTVGQGPIELAAYEIQADKLLAAALPTEMLDQGWVRLFDGQPLAGWNIVGQADWSCRDGILRVTRGDKSFLYTSFEMADCELQIDFRAGPDTNSGIFLRTMPEPGDVSLDCLEVNIAPPDNPFPTGSVVQRQRVEPDQLGKFDPTVWHTYLIRLDGENVTIQLDGKKIVEMVDDSSSRRGHISLQHNEGVVEFRNILMRPITSTALRLDSQWQQDWTVAEKEAGSMKVQPSEKGLHIHGGLGKVQSKQSYGDFLLHAVYSLASPEVNSGIFFRCIEDNMLDGYECQVNHAMTSGDPLAPSDAGAGAIFRRKPARIVVGSGTQPTHLTLLASGKQMVTWVNGLLVTEFYDDRTPDDNPRKGSRIQPGPIALQGHDTTTDATFHQLKITELR
ncbi:MAG TPA: DUF1080 domain-containing protein [Planctomycetaceae bacterium]|nr:DUF1080 domain-containing protein [Planctomycetaceae bacterium]